MNPTGREGPSTLVSCSNNLQVKVYMQGKHSVHVQICDLAEFPYSHCGSGPANSTLHKYYFEIVECCQGSATKTQSVHYHLGWHGHNW